MFARACLIVGLLVPGAVPGMLAQSAPADPVPEATESDASEVVYVHRDPTPEEVAAKEKAWKEKNPFKFSAYMPDYAKIKIVERVPKPKPEDVRAKEMEARIALLEKQAAAKLPPEPKSAVAKPVTAAAPAPAKPSAPNPAGVVMRKQSDGRVIAIVGGKSMVFANEQEARAHLAKLKP